MVATALPLSCQPKNGLLLGFARGILTLKNPFVCGIKNGHIAIGAHTQRAFVSD